MKEDSAFVGSQAGLPDLSHLTWGRFLARNLVPVTLGNIIGGALMVGAIYWFVYLRKAAQLDRGRLSSPTGPGQPQQCSARERPFPSAAGLRALPRGGV